MRTAPVSCTWPPHSVLVSVLLPAPLEPSNTTVWPRPSHGVRHAAASAARVSSANIGVPALNDARASSTRRSSAAGASVSALVITSTAGTPDRCASAR
jgi:hypothetical protein